MLWVPQKEVMDWYRVSHLRGLAKIWKATDKFETEHRSIYKKFTHIFFGWSLVPS